MDNSKSLIDQQLQLDAALNNMSQGLLMFDPTGRIVIVNRQYVQMYGLSPEVVRPGCPFYDLICHRKERGSFSGDVEQYCADIRAAIAQKKSTSLVVELLPSGRSIRIVNQPMANGGWVATHEDITEQRSAERDRDRNREFLDLIIENIPVTIYAKEANSRQYILINQAGEKLWGISRAEMLGKTAFDVFPKEMADRISLREDQLLQSREASCSDEFPAHTRSHDGTRTVTSKRLVIRNKNGMEQYLLGVIEDVTERKQADERIAYLAHLVTDLPNRSAFIDCLASVLERSAASKKHFAVLSIDLDRFKEVNDVFGHSIGDALLREVAGRLKIEVGQEFIARVGGDEFMVIATDATLPSQVGTLANRLLAAVADDIEIDGSMLRIGLSIGIAFYPDNGVDANKLLANADAALYQAKAEVKGSIRFFDYDLEGQLRDQRTLLQDLSLALKKGEMDLHYQPLAKLSGDIVGFEVLLRWCHPIRGMVPPATFIPLAEKSGLMISIGEWVLRKACAEAATWPKPLRIGVNLSPMQFRHRDFPLLVHSILLETGLRPNRLELEITEGVLIDDFSRAVSLLRRLKTLGIRIVMDDFGTGYSSLSYLHSFPFDKIKIDRLFVSDLEQNLQSATIVRAVIGLARGLGLPVAAEGVETEGQLAILAREGCDEVQGYLTGRPHPIEDYAESIGRLTTAKQKLVRAG